MAQSPVWGDAGSPGSALRSARIVVLDEADGGESDGSGRFDRARGAADPERPYAGPVTYDANDPATVFPPIEALRPPAGAPNVLVVLIDDVGFGASSAFGGPINTPTAERLAANGLKYTRFHTTALCSPTRAALLTGRNHHSVGHGRHHRGGHRRARLHLDDPQHQRARRPRRCATTATPPPSSASATRCRSGRPARWDPSTPGRPGQGFENFYGFIGGETNQWFPEVFEDTVPVEPDRTPEEGYHFTEDMADQAIDWIKPQKALMPDKPFFVYFAPGATHAPHQVPTEWIDKYKGQFDDGWDALRERTFARQKELGVIPADAELTRRHDEIPAWDDMPEELKPVLPRQMEIYAGFLEHTDHHVGRLIDALGRAGDPRRHADLLHHRRQRRLGRRDAQRHLQRDDQLQRRRRAGDARVHGRAHRRVRQPEAYNHYAVGWAHAMDTPYQWTKQVASHWGGTRNGTIVHWPAGIKAKGEVRSQFHHVIDVAPTILEAAGLPEPTMRRRRPAVADGRHQHGLQLQRRDAADRHTTQYFEMFGNRGIYHDGWTAVTRHSIPWDFGGQSARLQRRRLGAVRPRRLDPGPRPGRGDAREAGRAAAAVADRSGRTTSCPWTTAGPSGSTRPGRPAPADQGRTARCSSPAWPAERELCRRHQEQVATRSPPDLTSPTEVRRG